MTAVDNLAFKLNVRADSFAYMIEYLRTLPRTRRPTIVETGCIRSVDDYGAGYSTMIWELLSREMDLRVLSIDNNPVNVAFARRHCPRVAFRCFDSVAALAELDERVDLLYLDSYDLDQTNPHPSALHHILELCASVNLLERGALVAVDDNYDTVGKGMYVDRFMEATGRPCVFAGVQRIYQW